MTKQIDSSLENASVQSDQTTVQDGKWMLLSEAVSVTGLSEKTLRRYVKKRILRSKRIGKNTNSPIALWITPNAFQDLADEPNSSEADVIDTEFEDIELPTDSDDIVENVPVRSNEGSVPLDLSKVGVELDKILKTITDQFVEKLDSQSNAIFILKGELADKDAQLKLLPDLQKQMELQNQSAEYESAALKKQVEALLEENETLRKESEELKLKSATSKKSWWQSLFASPE